ncbi:restriction endonuclease subunit S [Lactobacillus gallinarum]|uniref:restriction endonuclease subunit S n=1 Tax=Lactobacillus gallinarum TaxID=52242 RepID=UPI00388FA794
MTPEQLKASILQYAMEGKLVKQDPNDEPASDTVKTKSMEESRTEPYKIPVNWKWIRLGSGVRFINGRAYKKSELLTDSNLTPVLRVGNLFTNSSWYYSDLKLDKDKYIDNGDLIYAWSASFGPRIWNGGHVIYHYHIWKTVIKEGIDKKFLYYFLSDPHNVLGETKLHGSTMKHVTKTNMEKLPFPLPPLEEQKRIVAKIEKLMPLVDEYAESYNRLQKINNEFEDKLKQSVLQYAMEGKLVKQNLSDESAINNLKEAREEIKQAINNKKLRNEKYLKAQNNGEYPKNWAVARLKEICEKNNAAIKRGPFGSSITKSMFVPKGKDTFKIYEQGNAIRKDINYGSYYITKDKFESLRAFEVKPGDIIISCAGTIGETFIIPSKMEPGIINQALLKLTLDTSIIDKDFFLLEFKSISSQLKLHAKGSAIKNLASLKYLKNKVSFPVPPLEEQKRIVKNVEKIMKAISELSK